MTVILNMKVIVIQITLSVKDYLNKNTPYLKDVFSTTISKKYDTWKTQLTVANIYFSSIDNNEEHVMHSKSHNTEIIINDLADEIIQELFDLFKIYTKII